MIESVSLRMATAADARAASRLIMVALHDLDAQAGRPPRDQPELASEPALRHLVLTDPERFWIAEAASPAAGARAGSAAGTGDGEAVTVGFGAAMVRGRVEMPGALWFLAGLFIHPDWQRRGVGRALLERTLAGYPAPGGVLAVVTSAANAQSNTLYSQYGMYPVLPLLSLSRKLPTAGVAGLEAAVSAGRADTPVTVGAVRAPSAGMAGAAPSGTLGAGERSDAGGPAAWRDRDLDVAPITVAALDRLRAIDLEVLGVDRTVDHEWLLREMKRDGWLFRRAGAPVGYGYLGGDGSQVPNQVGPLAALEPGDQPAMAGFLLDRAADCGWAAATFVVPGANLELQRHLSARGFVMSGTSELVGASRPFGRFDRYAFVGDALM